MDERVRADQVLRRVGPRRGIDEEASQRQRAPERAGFPTEDETQCRTEVIDRRESAQVGIVVEGDAEAEARRIEQEYYEQLGGEQRQPGDGKKNAPSCEGA
jgi:hypothetical protein